MDGVWVPLITPFRDNAVDHDGLRRLIDHYVGHGIAGLIPLGTTGEAPTLDDAEADAVVATTVQAAAGRVPVFVGAGGNATAKVVRRIGAFERHGPDGYLSVCPYYNRPTQSGLSDHFRAIADATEKPLLVYNIPYRTSVNLENDTLFDLAAVPNIVGVKDSSGSIAQSLDLLARRPEGLTVLTGEDPLYFTALCHGANGGILAAAHLMTARFVAIAERFAENDLQGARRLWLPLQKLLSLLFQEANPMPLKYCLWRDGLIESPECRLPLNRASTALRHALDQALVQIRAPGKNE